jgi:mitogen-activated protein kinase organizer 1
MDKTSGALLQEYSGQVNTKGYRIEAAIGYESKQVLSGSEDGSIYIWDLVKASKIKSLKPPDGSSDIVHSVVYHPSQEQLASASKSKIFVWSSE